MENVRLTQYSHGAGCGCKIAPGVLDRIIAHARPARPAPNLIVGNAGRDDAAAYDLGDGRLLLSTTDFFMPIVDDPYDFGRIASTNAISDVYAMGGTPLLAIAILGWPLDQLGPEVAARVMEGARDLCDEAGVALGGGHSIDAPEPIFGLAVNGTVRRERLMQNKGARPDDLLYLTKPLGAGILATAEKRGALEPSDQGVAARWMCVLNRVGPALAAIEGVHAMTDVTGFGLFGHLGEMMRASETAAEIEMGALGLMADLFAYIDRGCVPGGAKRNWESYGEGIRIEDEIWRTIGCDPQTSGGLLVAAAPEARRAIEAKLERAGLGDRARPIGRVVAAGEERTITARI